MENLGLTGWLMDGYTGDWVVLRRESRVTEEEFVDSVGGHLKQLLSEIQQCCDQSAEIDPKLLHIRQRLAEVDELTKGGEWIRAETGLLQARSQVADLGHDDWARRLHDLFMAYRNAWPGGLGAIKAPVMPDWRLARCAVD